MESSNANRTQYLNICSPSRVIEDVKARNWHAERLAVSNDELNAAILRDSAAISAITEQEHSLRDQCNISIKILIDLMNELHHASYLAAGLQALHNNGAPKICAHTFCADISLGLQDLHLCCVV